MEYRFSNPVDVFRLKRNVVASLEPRVLAMRRQALAFLQTATPVDCCPICRTKPSKTTMVIHGFEFRRCLECSHVYNSRLIPSQQLEEYYSDTNGEFPYSSTYSDDAEVQEIRKDSVAAAKVDYICSFLDERKRAGKWLDVACGNGDFLAVAQSRGFEVAGIEISPLLADTARRKHGIPVYEGTYSDYYEKNKTVRHDVIGFIGILTAVPEPMNYLAIARKMATDRGLIAINVHLYDCLSAAVQEAYNDQPVRFACPNLFHIFTEQSLQESVRRNGFEPLGMWFYGMDIYELINNLSLESFRFRHSRAREILIRLASELQRVIDQNRLCDEVMIVARKM